MDEAELKILNDRQEEINKRVLQIKSRLEALGKGKNGENISVFHELQAELLRLLYEWSSVSYSIRNVRGNISIQSQKRKTLIDNIEQKRNSKHRKVYDSAIQMLDDIERNPLVSKRISALASDVETVDVLKNFMTLLKADEERKEYEELSNIDKILMPIIKALDDIFRELKSSVKSLLESLQDYSKKTKMGHLTELSGYVASTMEIVESSLMDRLSTTITNKSNELLSGLSERKLLEEQFPLIGKMN